MRRTPKFDFLIVGAGLSGQLLARALAQRGQRVCLTHDPKNRGASAVAAWMINPVTGIRFVPSWRIDTFLPFAISTYRELEVKSGLTIWHPHAIHRLFQGPDEIPRWQKKRMSAVVQAYVENEFPGSPNIPGVTHTNGGITITGGGWADLWPWLSQGLQKPEFGIEIVDRPVSFEELQSGNLIFQDRSFARVIFCAGFDRTSLPWKPAKGELLTVRIPGLKLMEILLRGIFVIPLGADLYRVGATYEWSDLGGGASDAGVEYLRNKLEKLISLPCQIVDSQGAVRPILRDARPVLGLHRTDPRFGVFNGLGSKAALMAPWLARHFADHLIDGAPLDPEVDLDRC